MSSFLKIGHRRNIVEKSKVTKKHIKSFYNIVEDMQKLADQLDKDIDYTEDNINEYVKPIYNRDLDSMEKFVLLGKLHYGKEDNSNKPI